MTFDSQQIAGVWSQNDHAVDEKFILSFRLHGHSHQPAGVETSSNEIVIAVVRLERAERERFNSVISRSSADLNTRLAMYAEPQDERVDLIYIEPSFNSNHNYEVFWGDTKASLPTARSRLDLPLILPASSRFCHTSGSGSVDLDTGSD